MTLEVVDVAFLIDIGFFMLVTPSRPPLIELMSAGMCSLTIVDYGRIL